MGMFDYVECNYQLPDTPASVQKEVFQTKSFGDGFTGGFMDKYTITKEGELVLHKTNWEVVPEEKRSYYGKPEWDNNPLCKIMGSMKQIPVGDEIVNHHGYVNFYADIDKEWYEYEAKFTDGIVVSIKRIYREFGNE